MNDSARSRRVAVSADGRGLVSQAGAVLLWETMRVTGLGRGPSAALEPWRAPRAVHDPGKIVADLAAGLALGGDCLADIAVLREQPDLAGPVASDPVVSRLVRSLAADGPRALAAIRAARAAARERAWALAGDTASGADGGPVTIDLDATIVIAHSEKEQTAATRKKTFGHHPMTAWADHGEAGNGEPLVIVLRPGNAGSNTAADNIEAARLAVAQLPPHLRRKVLVRADSGGGTHEFLKWLTAKSPAAALLRRHSSSGAGDRAADQGDIAAGGPGHRPGRADRRHSLGAGTGRAAAVAAAGAHGIGGQRALGLGGGMVFARSRSLPSCVRRDMQLEGGCGGRNRGWSAEQDCDELRTGDLRGSAAHRGAVAGSVG